MFNYNNKNFSNEKPLRKRRFIYQKYHWMIEGFMIEFINQHKRLPEAKEVAAGLGISVSTVRRHKKDIRISNYMEEFRIFTPKVIMALLDRALKGSASEVKLWLQYIEGWGENKEKDIPMNIVVELPEEMQDRE